MLYICNDCNILLVYCIIHYLTVERLTRTLFIMAKGSELTPEKKSVIVALSKEGLSTRKIASRIGFHHSTVSRLLKKAQETGKTDRIPGRGRKRASTNADDRILKRMCLSDRHLSSTELKRDWQDATGVRVSSRTVRNRLCEVGLNARRPRKKPLLTKKMRLQRLEWAREHEGWTKNMWNKVIFSDESKFNLHGSDGKTYVRRRIGEEFQPSCLINTVKHPQGQMIWGCISYHGVGRLHFIQGTVNADVYIDILKTALIPTIAEQYRNIKSCIFQDDSAPCHRAKKVRYPCFFLLSFDYIILFLLSGTVIYYKKKG